jgi:DNA-binding FadR family transcriptional regulator
MQPDINSVSELVKVERRSAAADVQAQLQSLIQSGRFKQNERLPSEIELARRFGVSRPVVREALMSLQTLGLTASQSGKGTFVISDRIRTPLLLGRYSPAHIKEVRRALEIPSAQFAAMRRSDKDVGQLAALLARMDDADDPARRNKLDADFHIAIAMAAGNSLIMKLIEDMRTILEEHSLALAKAPHRRKAASIEHARIYDAIVRRDPDAAGAAMAAHVDAAEQSFASLGLASTPQTISTSLQSTLDEVPR